MGSFTIKTIKVTIQLAEGLFDNGTNTTVIEGLPIHVDVDKPGGQDMNKMSMVIKGLKLETMEKLTVLSFRPLQTYNNIILVEAGDKGEVLGTVFSGEINKAVPVFSTNGDVSFKIEAATGSYANKIASEPVSIKGVASVAELMQQFANEAGYAFENHGVNMSVKNSIFKGPPTFKAKRLAYQVGIELLIDNMTFKIFAKNHYLEGTATKLSSANGLFGYPSFTNDGIDVNCLYDPRLVLGGLVEIKSVVPKTTGTWKINKLAHNLDAYQTNGGSWQSKFSGVWVGENKSE